MNKSESITKIAPALIAAQKAIKAALKDSTNPHFRSKYADLSSVIEAVKEPLNANGIMFTRGVGMSDSGVTVETMLLHSTGEWISETLTIPVLKQDAQGVGSAITYGRRYGLQALCGVPAEDDDGNAATKAAPQAHKSVAQEAWDCMPVVTQQALQEVTAITMEYIDCDDDVGAIKYIDAQGLGTDEKAALWSRLDSKTRSRLKKAGEKLKEAA